MARKSLKHLKLNKCFSCGYTKHVEMSHIIPVKDFPDSALIKEVNSVENVIPLCPNCHWEFDNNNMDRITLIENWKIHVKQSKILK